MAYNHNDDLRIVEKVWDSLPLHKQIKWAVLIEWETWNVSQLIKKTILAMIILLVSGLTIWVASQNWAAGVVLGVVIGLLVSAFLGNKRMF